MFSSFWSNFHAIISWDLGIVLTAAHPVKTKRKTRKTKDFISDFGFTFFREKVCTSNSRGGNSGWGEEGRNKYFEERGYKQGEEGGSIFEGRGVKVELEEGFLEEDGFPMELS